MMDQSETGTLIGSDKVEGTAVYGMDREKIGSIERVMIDKISGRVSYAVLGFGGILGLGRAIRRRSSGQTIRRLISKNGGRPRRIRPSRI